MGPPQRVEMKETVPCQAEIPVLGVVSRGRRAWGIDLGMLALLAAVWFGSLLGLRPLSNPDEGRYAEIPREMAASGDWVTPRLNGVKYFEKPPLLYWLSAATFRVAGCNEFTARLWNALFAVGGVLLTYAAARILHGRAAGWFAALVLGTSVLYYGLSQVLLLDMAASVTMGGALFSFLLAMRHPAGKTRKRLLLAGYAAMGLATLTKGLIGVVLPGAVIFCWCLLLGRWRALRPFHPLAGGTLFLAIAGPWHLLAARANAGFLDFYFIHEHFLRFTTTVHGRTGPWWYFLAVLALGLLPWAGFAWQGVRRALAGGWRERREHDAEWFLAIWVVVVVGFFSVSKSKLVPYILPVWPPLAVLAGRAIAEAWCARQARAMRTGVAVFVAAAVLLGIGVWLAPAPAGWAGSVLEPWRRFFTLVLAGGAGTAWWAWRRNRPGTVAAAVGLSAAMLLATFNPLAMRYDRRSGKEIAGLLNKALGPGDRVYSVGFYPQDLPFYLGRLLHVVNYKGELAYGIDAEPGKNADRFLRDDGFAEQWRQPGVAYVVIMAKYYDWRFLPGGLPHQVIGRSGDCLLLTNQLPSSES